MKRRTLKSKLRSKKQRRQRTRRVKTYRQTKGQRGGTFPNTNPSNEQLKKEGAVFTIPMKVEEYGPEEVIDKA